MTLVKFGDKHAILGNYAPSMNHSWLSSSCIYQVDTMTQGITYTRQCYNKVI